jgi:phenylpropionate dioxygenase-like ring-hydroxylating dioxygenase large terminal subunit
MGLLSPPKLESYRGFVFACYDPDAADLRTYLAGAADYLDLVADQAEAMEIAPGAHEFSADANWKLYMEKTLDAYHLLPLHITYFEYVDKTVGGRSTSGDVSRRGGRIAPRCRRRSRRAPTRPASRGPRPGRGTRARRNPPARRRASRSRT